MIHLGSGKWLIFARSEKIDEAWLRVKTALSEGKLGRLAKVARAKSTRLDERDWKMKQVICIYTYDYADREDVRRVRQALRDIGCTRRIAYKDDEKTARLQYGYGTSRYYE